MPSWVPDWRLESRNFLLCPAGSWDDGLDQKFDASSRSPAGVSFPLAGVIRTKCLIIDDVAERGSLGYVEEGKWWGDVPNN